LQIQFQFIRQFDKPRSCPLENSPQPFRLFESELWLPKPRADVFQFFSEAQNLQTLTPDWLNFEILTPSPVKMEAGALIEYRIRVRGIPFRWKTRIEAWNPPESFVDVQLGGPYRLWHHTHTFIERDGGTLCRDSVRYWPKGGRLMDWLFVRRDVKTIFNYRAAKLREIFGSAGR
jgi:ligand-binding SRPBCC domain-containing protein